MRNPQKAWTTHEIKLMERMIARGWQAPQIARWLKRSTSSVHGKAAQLRLSIKRGGRGRQPENMVKKSDRLAASINKLLDSMSPEARSFALGRAESRRSPGTERIYRGQMAEREFARPIGEIIKPIVARIMEGSQAA